MALTKVDQTMVSDQVFGRRNLIINGDMRVAQRGTSASSISSGGDYLTVDRFRFSMSSAGTWDISQSTTVPSGEGFAYSQKIDCTTADASLDASNYLLWVTALEGQNLQHTKFGTSSAEKLTLSFWVRSAKTGTYVVEFINSAAGGNRTQSQSYTISSANTWEKKTITIDGDTATAFDNSTAGDLALYFWLAAGSNYSGGTLNTSWNSSTNANRAAGQVNLADSTSNDWYITGVQLEVGDNATPFEHLSYGEELALCERYYQLCRAGYAEGYSSTNGSLQLTFGTPMRATPSATLVNGTNALLNIGVSFVSISSLGGMELGNTHGATHTAAWSATAGVNYIMTGGVVGVSADI
jgi:hypothetical protein